MSGYPLLSLFSHSSPSEERFTKKNAGWLASPCVCEKVHPQCQVPREEKARAAIHVSAPFVSNWFLSRDEVETTRKMSVINYFHSFHSNYLNGLPFT